MMTNKVYLDNVSSEELLGELLTRLSLNLDSDGLCDTPKRVLSFWQEFIQPIDLVELVKRSFSNAGGSKGMVAQKGIPFRALCEHHLLPFYGHAHIAYIPRERVVGLSKVTRLVKAAGTRRPTIQERITEDVASALMRGLNAQGVIVVIEAEHTCMSVRGVTSPGVTTFTSAVKGLFRDAPHTREEFFNIIR